MQYSFDILGVSPILHFFNHQLEQQEQPRRGAEYIGASRCTLDAFLEPVEKIPSVRGWELDQVVDSVIHYWMRNAETIQRWKSRLEEAGNECLLIGRIGHYQALQADFEALFDK